MALVNTDDGLLTQGFFKTKFWGKLLGMLSKKLNVTGNASNTTSTFTKANGDTSSMASGSKLSAIFTAISSFFASVASALGGKADKANITGATKCKITYNSQGIVTAGANLEASDIPNLAASKITSGTFGTSFIADDAITAAKVKDNETLPVNVSGRSHYVRPFIVNKGAKTSNVWAKVATASVSAWNGYAITLAAGFDGYANANTYAAEIAVGYQAGNGGAYANRQFYIYRRRYPNTNILDAKLVRSGDTLELWVKDGITDTSLYLVPVYHKGFSPNYADSDDRSKQLTDSAFSDYIADKTKYDASVRTVAFIPGMSQVGSTSTPVYVDSDGQVQPCDPSQMGVGAASYAAAADAAASGSTLETQVNKGLKAYKETYTNVTLIQGNIYSKTIVLEIGQENSPGNGIRLFLNNNNGTFEVSIRSGTWNSWMDGGSVIWMLQASFGVGVNSPVTKINNDTKSLAILTTQTIGEVDIGGSPGQYPINGTISGRFYFVNNAASGILTFEASFSTSQSTQYGGLNDTFVIGKAEWTSFADHKVTSILT